MTEATSRLNVEINSKPAKSGADEVINQFKRMQQFSKGIWGAFADASKSSYNAANSYIKKLKGEFESLGKTVTTIGRGIKSAFSFTSTAISSLGIYALLRSITDVGLATSKFTNLLTISVGSIRAASKELSNLKSLANDLGLVYRDSVIPYAKFFAASIRSIDSNDIRDIFKAFGEATVALQLNKQEIQGVFLALQQMSSKGKVSMEELRLQLAERIPGAMQLAADAMGITIQELEDNVRKGLVSAAELLPKFAKEMHETFGVAAELASKSVIGAFARLDNAIFEFMSNLANGGYMDALAEASDQIAEWLNGNTEAAVALGVEIGDIAQGIANYITSIDPDDIASGFDALKTTLGTINQIFINLGNNKLVQWIIGDIRSDTEQVLETLNDRIKEIQDQISWNDASIYFDFSDENAALSAELEVLKQAIDDVGGASSRASKETEAMEIEINRSARSALEAEAAQNRLRIAVADANEAIRTKSELLKRTASQELATVQKELAYYRDRLDHYEDYNLTLSDVTTTKEKILSLIEKEIGLLEDVAKETANSEKEYDKMAKNAIEAVEKQNEFIMKESDRLVKLAAEYGSTKAQIILYNNELDKVTEALRAIGATEAEIAAATAKLWNEGPGKAAVDVSKEAKKEWEKTADSINDALTDALMSGFEDGKSFAQNFRDTLENMFKTLVLRPVIQAIVQPAAAGATDVLGSTLGSDGLGILDIASTANSASGLLGGGGIFGEGSSFVTGLNSFGSSLGISSTAAAAATSTAELASFGTAPFSAISNAGIASTGLGSSLAAAAPWLGIGALALPLLGGLFKDTPDPRFYGSGSLGAASITGAQDMEAAAAQPFVDVLNAYEQQFLDLLTDAERQALADFQPTDLTHIHGSGDAGAEHELSAHIVTRIAEGLWQLDSDIAAAYSDAVHAITDTRELRTEDIDALMANVLAPIYTVRQAMDEVFDELASINNIVTTTESVISGAGSLEAYTAGIATYVERFAADADAFSRQTATLEAALAALGIDAIPQTVAGFRTLVEGLDLTTTEGQSLHGSLIALAPAIADWQQANEDLTWSLEDIEHALQSITGLFSDTYEDIMLSGMDTQQQYQYYAAEAERLVASFGTLTTPQEVEAVSRQVNEMLTSAWGLLDPEQQSAIRGDLLSYIEDVNAVAASRIETLVDERGQQDQDLITGMDTAVTDFGGYVNLIADAADLLQDAANDFNAAVARFDAPGMAVGGPVPGAWNGQSGTAGDTILAALTPGEFVVPRAQAQRYGGLLEQIRAGRVGTYASGGYTQDEIAAWLQQQNPNLGSNPASATAWQVLNLANQGNMADAAAAVARGLGLEVSAGRVGADGNLQLGGVAGGAFRPQYDISGVSAPTSLDDIRSAVESGAAVVESLGELSSAFPTWPGGTAGGTSTDSATAAADDLSRLADFMAGINRDLRDLDLSDYERQLAAIDDRMLANITTATELGATEADLQKIRDLAAGQVAALEAQRREQLTDYLDTIQTNLDSLSMSDFEVAVVRVNAQLDDAIDKINDLGGSEADLAMAREYAAAQIAQLAEQERDRARSELMDAYQREIDTLYEQQAALEETAADAKQVYLDVLGEEITAIEQAADQWAGIADTLRDAAQSILGSALSPEQSLAFTRQQYTGSLQSLWAGDPVAAADLPGQATSYLAAIRNTAGSSLEYRRGAAEIQSQLHSAADRAKAQAGREQAQLDELLLLREAVEDLDGLPSLAEARNDYLAAQQALAMSDLEQRIAYYQAELDVLAAIEGAVLSIAEAQENYDQAGVTDPIDAGFGPSVPPPGYADGGIASGPLSGYPAMLHGTEAIIPLDSGAVPVQVNMSDLVAEIRGLREDLRAVGGEQTKAAKRAEKILRKWDIDGQPDTRVA